MKNKKNWIGVLVGGTLVSASFGFPDSGIGDGLALLGGMIIGTFWP